MTDFLNKYITKTFGTTFYVFNMPHSLQTDIPHELGLKALNYITKSGSLIPQRFYKEFLL